MLSFNIQLSPHNLPQCPSTLVRNYRKCNYDQLKHDLSLLDWNSIFSSCTCSAEYRSAFTLTINNLLDIHCPTFIPPPDPNERKPFYYPPSIIRLQARKRKLWKITRSSSCESSRANYKAASNAYRDAVDAFHLAEDSIVLNSHESSDFYKFIGRKLNRSSSTPLCGSIFIPSSE